MLTDRRPADRPGAVRPVPIDVVVGGRVGDGGVAVPHVEDLAAIVVVELGVGGVEARVDDLD